MSQPEFNEAEWIENLGTALAALAGNEVVNIQSENLAE